MKKGKNEKKEGKSMYPWRTFKVVGSTNDFFRPLAVQRLVKNYGSYMVCYLDFKVV